MKAANYAERAARIVAAAKTDDTLTAADLAERFGVTAGTVNAALRRAGVLAAGPQQRTREARRAAVRARLAGVR